jgi:hypothetical protein
MSESTDVNSMEDPYSEMLYRYRHFNFTSEQHAREPEQIIVDNTLWCSHPTSFNDPFDCSPVYTWNDISVDEQIRRVRGMLARRGIPEDHPIGVDMLDKARRNQWNAPELRATLASGVQDAIRNSSVCCFNRTWQDPRMWAQYAANQQGYCLGFKLEGGWPVDAFPIPVIYVDERPIVDLALDTMTDKKAARRFVDDALLTKSRHWEGEGEVRVFRHGRPAGLFEFPPDALRELYLGLHIKAEHREQLLAAARKRRTPIDVYQLSAHPEKYEFLCEKIDLEEGGKIR